MGNKTEVLLLGPKVARDKSSDLILNLADFSVIALSLKYLQNSALMSAIPEILITLAPVEAIDKTTLDSTCKTPVNKLMSSKLTKAIAKLKLLLPLRASAAYRRIYKNTGLHTLLYTSIQELYEQEIGRAHV